MRVRFQKTENEDFRVAIPTLLIKLGATVIC